MYTNLRSHDLPKTLRNATLEPQTSSRFFLFLLFFSENILSRPSPARFTDVPPYTLMIISLRVITRPAGATSEDARTVIRGGGVLRLFSVLIHDFPFDNNTTTMTNTQTRLRACVHAGHQWSEWLIIGHLSNGNLRKAPTKFFYSIIFLITKLFFSRVVVKLLWNIFTSKKKLKFNITLKLRTNRRNC